MKPTGKLGKRVPLRILAADDIATNRDLIRFLARHLGYQVDLVNDGLEVLEQIEKQKYDLILLDVQMPRLDGLSAARAICRREPDRALRPKLVAVTASLPVDGPAICMAAGMDDYLAKPLLPEHLSACIERLFTDNAVPQTIPPIQLDVPTVNWNHLRAMTQGLDQNHAWACVTLMRTTVTNDFETIRPRLSAACLGRQADALARELHGLKGCVLSLGLSCMGKRCAEVLAEVRAGRFQGWADLPAEIDDLFSLSSAALNDADPSVLSPPVSVAPAL